MRTIWSAAALAACLAVPALTPTRAGAQAPYVPPGEPSGTGPFVFPSALYATVPTFQFVLGIARVSPGGGSGSIPYGFIVTTPGTTVAAPNCCGEYFGGATDYAAFASGRFFVIIDHASLLLTTNATADAITGSIALVPEPAPLALTAAALAGMGLLAVRRQRRA